MAKRNNKTNQNPLPHCFTDAEWHAVDRHSMPHDECCDKLFAGLETEPALLPPTYCEEVELGIQSDATRRAGLLFLTKPFKEMSEAISADRALAIAFADVSIHLEAAIERYKGLANLLQTAHTRMRLALCAREDMAEVLAQAKA